MKGISHLAVLAALMLFWMTGTTETVARTTVSVHNATIPVIIDRQHNILAEICITVPPECNATLGKVSLRMKGMDRKAVRDIRLIYTGTMSALTKSTTSFVMWEKWRDIAGGQTVWCDPAFAVETTRIRRPDTDEDIIMECSKPLFPGKNYFYVSTQIIGNRVRDISLPFTMEVTEILVDGAAQQFAQSGSTEHRLGVSVRQSGDDGVHSYRIPGLATSNKGTLLGIYDVRYNSSFDLQSNIDIGLSRSTDGGKTWEKMRIVMDMGEWGGLPQAQNGTGDPAILVDRNTGEIFITALWTAGIGNDRAWQNVGQGMTPYQTGQILLVSSKDDGKTWSLPRNITSQIKQPHWYITLQGPGNGITMNDGTLVFAMQHVDSTRVPHAGIMYSKDHGETWHTHSSARANTTEAQVVELPDGSLMLNMRDNRKTGRAVAVTSDLGMTWTEHPSSGQLIESVCMASLIRIKAEDNIFGKDILLFSNPATDRMRHNMTIKASIDNGRTWKECDSLLIDEEHSWGYSCLSRIDGRTVGILYEGSTAQMTFQAIRLEDIISGLSDEK